MPVIGVFGKNVNTSRTKGGGRLGSRVAEPRGGCLRFTGETADERVEKRRDDIHPDIRREFGSDVCRGGVRKVS